MVAQHAFDESRLPGALGVVHGVRRFHFTGSLLPTSVYVERPADRLLLALLREGTYCHILAPRQIGKSSLRARVTRELKREGIRCASVDLTVCGSSADPEQWYFGLVSEVASRLSLPDPLSFWEEHRHVAASRRWAAYLEHILKTDVEKRRVVILLDEIESVRLVPFPIDDFLLSIRGLFEARSEDEDFCRLTFCLIGVTTPNDLVKDKLITPFNVSTQVRLDDFTREQMNALGPGLADLGPPATPLLDAVYEWTDGHPYMTMRACAALVGRGRVEPGQEREIVEQVVREQFLERPLEDANLSYAARRFEDTRHERQGAPIGERIALYRRLLDGKQVPADSESAVQMELRLSGMIKDVEGTGGRRLKIRNKIFETALDRDWLTGKQDQWVVAERKKIRDEERERAEELMKLRAMSKNVDDSLADFHNLLNKLRREIWADLFFGLIGIVIWAFLIIENSRNINNAIWVPGIFLILGLGSALLSRRRHQKALHLEEKITTISKALRSRIADASSDDGAPPGAQPARM
jgi:AAA-like domain